MKFYRESKNLTENNLFFEKKKKNFNAIISLSIAQNAGRDNLSEHDRFFICLNTYLDCWQFMKVLVMKTANWTSKTS